MFIIKLIIAGFLLFLNVFSFLLVKYQKADREKKILQNIAQGNGGNINFEEKSAPDNEERQKALNTLEDEEKPKDNQNVFADTENQMPRDKSQFKEEKEQILEKFNKKPVSDFKLILCSVLGGSIGIYTALFIFRYRLRDILMMVMIPTILVLNIYIYLQVFTVWLILPLRNTAVFIPLFR